jgi:uncharacterized repeat protein (TIGR01451 family)
MPRRSIIAGAALALLMHGAAFAQDRTGYYYPLDHRQPPGIAGQWQTNIKRGIYGYMQPVRFIVPTGGTVSYYQGSPQNSIETVAPSQARMMVGHVYRVKISGIPERPGLELFPTIEILDRLHPPEGKLEQYPIPVEITEQEIEAAEHDRMVTKVVFLEQPDIAAPASDEVRIRVEELDSRVNLLEAADMRGRPIAIVRIGGRVPDVNSPTDEFYSQSPLLIGDATARANAAGNGVAQAGGAIDHEPLCRVPVSVPCPPVGGACPPCRACGTADYMPSPEELADEYICDGGDQGDPAFYNTKVRDGIGPEDTVVTYISGNAETRVRASNKVCIYAPRFAAVRSITTVGSEDHYHKLGGLTEDKRVAGYDARMRLDERDKRDMLLAVRYRDRASGLYGRQSEGRFEKTIKAENHIKIINVYQDLGFVQDGQFRITEAATIAKLALAAGEWSLNQTPIIVAEDIGGQQLKATFKPVEYVGVEDPRKDDDLSICKLVDKTEAVSGDIVTFTLRIDNLGKDALYSVVVTDSLTPRLELLPDSLQSTLEGDFSVQPNKEGSSVINFTLKNELKGKTGGVITFQCKVR